MSDLFGFGPSFSFPGGVSGPGVSKELRQRIALAMLTQKRKAPSTFGEGLSAIGDSLGDIGTMRRLAAEENAAFTGGNAKADELLGGKPPADAQAPSPVQAAAISAPSSLYQPPDQDPRSQAPVPPTVQEGGPTPTTQPMFRPNLRTATPPTQAPPPAAPAVPAPPDVPGATRMSTPEQMADFRAQNPLPQNIPPMPPPGGPPPGLPPQPARPSVADYGQKLALAPTPPAAPPGPVMAQGPDPASLPMAPQDDPRRAIGLALMKQRMGGQGAPPPPPAPMPSPVPSPNQGIAPAPPAAPPIAPMPAGPQPGYVSQPLKPVIAPTPEPMSQHEADLREAIARDPDGANGQLARRLSPVIQTLESNRTAINQRNIEKYKLDLAAEIAREQKIEEQKTGAAKDVATVAHTQAQTRKESMTDTPEEKFVVGPDGIARPLRIEGATNREPPLPKNEFQLKSLKHHEQMVDAEKIIGEGKALRSAPSATGSRVPIVGGYFQSDAYRKERAAAERWVVNKLRPESGAQFSETEIDREVRAYFPQPSDDAKTVADKNAARRLANEGMLESSGREGKKYMEWKNARAAEADAAKAAERADAEQWLKDNPNDPRVAKVKKWLGQ